MKFYFFFEENQQQWIISNSHIIFLAVPLANLIVTVSSLEDSCVTKQFCDGKEIYLPYPNAIIGAVEIAAYIIVGALSGIDINYFLILITGFFLILCAAITSMAIEEYIIYCSCQVTFVFIISFLVSFLNRSAPVWSEKFGPFQNTISGFKNALCPSPKRN